ncbi:hypothetical protein K3152_01315 [Qipengyuania sp. 1NDH17]|uniref:DUF4131 domain-containing protein n=1 Tax=Qipengyuania polymorpha TaxID=2867234 RepID=A0ABS7IU21_9SPHN|nr:hypothetical protein [Qipengyuania polymorpha]MBX7456876.1 hypothetical protein [Qipengyuania polymorpha]
MRLRASDTDYAGTMWPTVFWAVCAIGLLIPSLMLLGSIAPNFTLFCLTYCCFLFMARRLLDGTAVHFMAFVLAIGTFILVPTVQRAIASRALELYQVEAIEPSAPIEWSGHVRVESALRSPGEYSIRRLVEELLLSGDVHTVTVADVRWSEFSELTSKKTPMVEEEMSFGWSKAGDCLARLEAHWRNPEPPPPEIGGARQREYRDRLRQLTSDCLTQTEIVEGFDWRLRYGTWREVDDTRETKIVFGRYRGEVYGDGLKVDFITLEPREGDYALRLFHPMRSAWKVPFEVRSTRFYTQLLDVSGLRIVRSYYPEEQYWRDDLGHWLGEGVARDVGYGSAIPFGFLH